MRFLVLGANGQLGSAITRTAAAGGHEVHAVVRDTGKIERLSHLGHIHLHGVTVYDNQVLAGLIAEVEPDAVVHAAFPSCGFGADSQSRSELVHTGLGLALAVTEAVRQSGFNGNFITIGSALAYGPSQDPHQEADPPKPVTFRGAVKAAESLLVSQFAQQANCSVIELCVFTAYGPWEESRRLIPTLMRAALSGETVSLAPQPHYRDRVFLDDVAAACLVAAAGKWTSHSKFNICTGRITGIHEIAELVQKITGQSLIRDRDYIGLDKYGDPRPLAVPASQSRGFPWVPAHDLESGLERTWEWACSDDGRKYLLN